MRRALVWSVAVMAGCAPLRCAEHLAAREDAAGPPADARLPLGRHWSHQTLDEMLVTGDPDAPMFETAAAPILGLAYADALAKMGATEPTVSCTGNILNSRCQDTTIDRFYRTGFVDDRPLWLWLEVTRDSDDEQPVPVDHVRGFSVELDDDVADPDVVQAALRKKLGPPTRHLQGMEMEWARGTRDITFHHWQSSTITIRLRIGRDPSPSSTMTDATKLPACRRLLVVYDAFTQCTAIDLHARELQAIDMDPYEWDLANCTRETASFAQAMKVAGCALPP
jgi:hypothetical protein